MVVHKDAYGETLAVHPESFIITCAWCRESPPIAQPNPEAVNYMYGGPQPTFRTACLALQIAWLALVGEALGVASNLVQAWQNWRGVVRR